MNLRIKLISGFLVLFFAGRASAQNFSCPCREKYQKETEKITAHFYPYLFPRNEQRFLSNWARGDIYEENGTVIKNKFLRYECIKDELVWKRESDSRHGIVYKQEVCSFVLHLETGKDLHFVKRNIDQTIFSEGSTFLEVLYSGPVSLYKQHIKEMNKMENIFYYRTKYYVEKDGQIKRIKPGKRSLMKYFIHERNEVKEMINRNKLKVRFEEDLVEFFDIFNEDYVKK